MTLNWTGTRTQDNGIFNLAGLGRPARKDSVGLEILPRGNLKIEAEVLPHIHPVNPLRDNMIEPWSSEVTVSLEPGGTLLLSMRDAKRIMQDRKACTVHDGVGFVAVANAPCPLGAVAIRDIKVGDKVNVQGGREMQVLWTGHTTVSALERFAPMHLHQLYIPSPLMICHRPVTDYLRVERDQQIHRAVDLLERDIRGIHIRKGQRKTNQRSATIFGHHEGRIWRDVSS